VLLPVATGLYIAIPRVILTFPVQVKCYILWEYVGHTLLLLLLLLLLADYPALPGYLFISIL
jgi:hypothetical protein